MKQCLILPIVLGLTLTACNLQSGTEDSTTMDSATVAAPQGESTPMVVTEKINVPPASEQTMTATTAKPKPIAVKPKHAVAPAKSKEKTTPETIYVETYGAQGKVWGHVTMNGDRGAGTIHDYDENTLTVTVTRHGDELFAVDQNSRQYVFKLKQNKTQE